MSGYHNNGLYSEDSLSISSIFLYSSALPKNRLLAKVCFPDVTRIVAQAAVRLPSVFFTEDCRRNNVTY